MDHQQQHTHGSQPSGDNTEPPKEHLQPPFEDETEHHQESETITRLREKHRKLKSKARKMRRTGKRRLIFWGQVLIILFICITAGLTIRAFELTTIKGGGLSWFEEMKLGNYEVAAEKFSITASAAVSRVFSSDLSTETIMRDFNAALPHLRRSGYILTELEVEIGIPPKLIPHFYHNPAIKMDREKTLKAVGDNTVGSALIIALAEAAELQKNIEDGDMQFNHIEVELGPIPALKLKYVNDDDLHDYLNRKIYENMHKK